MSKKPAPTRKKNATKKPAPRTAATRKPKTRRTKPTREKKELFLEHLAQTGIVTQAAEAVNFNRPEVYKWREDDAEFAAAWDAALEEAADRLEAEAHRRAYRGTKRYKFTSRGVPITNPDTGGAYYEVEYSDTLLIFLLKAHRPHKFRERFEHTGADGEALSAPVQIYLPDNGRGGEE